MNILDLKNSMYKNPSYIISALEGLGCHNIKLIPDKRVQCALPDGDNPTSVQVLLSDNNLNTVVHTRDDYEGGDIISFIEYILKTNFRGAVNWLSNLLGYSFIRIEKEPEPKFLNILDDFCDFDNCTSIENIPISDSYFHEFIMMPHNMFVQDGISVEAQRKMQICYDINDSRILIPIRDLHGNLITLKGRTTIDNYKDLKIPKYMAYFEYHGSTLLYGYSENYWDIIAKNEVIVVESEKSVLQAMSIGINNVVALSTNKMSDYQLNALLDLQCDVVLALDKDIKRKTALKELNKFGNICNKYLIIDNNDLLGEKDSPFDKGKDVWLSLYDKKERVM